MCLPKTPSASTAALLELLRGTGRLAAPIASRYLRRSRDALIKIVGHADGRMIDRVYAHFGIDELAEHMQGVSWRDPRKVIRMPGRAARASTDV